MIRVNFSKHEKQKLVVGSVLFLTARNFSGQPRLAGFCCFWGGVHLKVWADGSASTSRRNRGANAEESRRGRAGCFQSYLLCRSTLWAHLCNAVPEEM